MLWLRYFDDAAVGCGGCLLFPFPGLGGRQAPGGPGGLLLRRAVGAKEIQQTLQALEDAYAFDPLILKGNISTAALSRFSQETLSYWYKLIQGVAEGTPPTWDTAPMAQALQEDAAFAARWQAQGAQAMAAQAAQELAAAVQNAVSPMRILPHRLELFSARGYSAKAAFWGVLLLLLSVLPVVAIRLLQHIRPFQTLWFVGGALLAAFLGCMALLAALRGFPLRGLLEEYSPLLALYGGSLLSRLQDILAAFGGGYAGGGAVLLTVFFLLRYRRISTTHHELSSFF